MGEVYHPPANPTSLYGVQADDLDGVWDAVLPLLIPALERSGRYTPDAIKADIAARFKQLWIAHADGRVEAIAITSVLAYPLGKSVKVWLCTGTDRARWLDHVKTIEAWAKAQGCDRIEAVTRPGWEKVLTDYHKTHVTLEKRL